jgi:hypothetical protein
LKSAQDHSGGFLVFEQLISRTDSHDSPRASVASGEENPADFTLVSGNVTVSFWLPYTGEPIQSNARNNPLSRAVNAALAHRDISLEAFLLFFAHLNGSFERIQITPYLRTSYRKLVVDIISGALEHGICLL